MPKSIADDHAALYAGEEDDFARISGLDPLIAHQFHELGVHTYAQFAALAPEELIGVLNQFPLLATERIIAQSWREQALRLAAERSHADLSTTASSGLSLSFMVELLIEAPRTVRRTRLTHAASGETSSWAGWNEAELLAAIDLHIARRAVSTAESLVGLSLAQLRLEEPDADQTIDELSAQIQFGLTGTHAAQVAASEVQFLGHVLACDLNDGQSLLLATLRGQCRSGQTSYTERLRFGLPVPGRYQLYATVLIPDAQLVASLLGPVLRVIA